MDERKIFECIAKKQPGVRAVQISDLLDVPLSEVSEALRDLVEGGQLVRKSGFAPNGAPAQQYDFSESFKATNDYKAVMASVAPASVAFEVKSVAPVPNQPAQKAVDVSTSERLVAHILKTGGATDDQLRAAVGLKSTQYPSSYLSHAQKVGRITRRGVKWIPADGRAPALPPKSTNVPSFLAETKPAVPTVKPKEVPIVPPEKVSASAQPLRCGIWSDGVVELQRGGSPIAFLSQDEADFMAAFLVRVTKVAA